MHLPAAHLHADEGISAQFAEALSLADKVILADIYAARETDTLGISSEDIVKLLKEKGKEAWYLPTFDRNRKFVIGTLYTGRPVDNHGRRRRCKCRGKPPCEIDALPEYI